jgi:hypothetical protein
MDNENDNPVRDHEIEHDLKALEHRLVAWRPLAGTLDRDRMLYDAGRAAAADGHVRSWRLATAAWLLVTVGLGGLLVHQWSLLERERSLLAQEQSPRMALETTLAARTGPLQQSAPAPSPTSAAPAIEPLAPTSYFALTSRLARGDRNLSSPDLEREPGPHRPTVGPSEAIPHPGPLQPRDLQRVLDLSSG